MATERSAELPAVAERLATARPAAFDHVVLPGPLARERTAGLPDELT